MITLRQDFNDPQEGNSLVTVTAFLDLLLLLSG